MKASFESLFIEKQSSAFFKKRMNGKDIFRTLMMLLISSLFFPAITAAQDANQLNLNGGWKVTWNDGNHGPNSADEFSGINPLNDTLRYMDVEVPMDLNIAMQKKGMIGNLNYGGNYLAARWVSEQYWQYYRQFSAPREALNKSAWLKFDRLDYSANIYLNGDLIGRHDNTFIPCLIDLSGKLKEGINILTVGIESGLYDSSNKNLDDYNSSLNVHLNKRHWLRKPQYQFSWDWNPQLINIGITGDVSLIWRDEIRLDNIVPWIKMADDLSAADIKIRTFIEGTKGSSDLTIDVTLVETKQQVSRQITVSKGIFPYELKMRINNPKLWWPVGHGDPNLYTLKVDVKKDGKIIDTGYRKIGFRKIEIDRSQHPVEGNYFTIKINNRSFFMKGGNWVPADMIYSNVDTNRLKKLIDMAVDANFNILRIWGGGLFAGNELLRLCDENGILVWHDFLFACSKYPGDNVDFYNNVKKEVTWAVREFAYHPSLIVWCGNNELEWGTWGWGYANSGKVVPDYLIYHHLMPVIMKEEDPYRFYWPSSPYSENFEFPNSSITGDQHPWEVSLGKDTTNFWAYRNYVDRFPNEGGVLGASSPASLRQFLPPGEQFVRSFSWDLHDNMMNFVTDKKGVTYRFIKDWLDKDYTKMSFDDYAFASALLQSEGLMEYINNYHRRMYGSSSAIFWMYNDSWPVTHGWTIVDYYLRKKLAYHPVRRAFKQICVVVAEEGNNINIYGINEKQQPWKGKLQYGLFSTSGKFPVNELKNVTLLPNTSTVIASFDKSAFVKAGIKNHGAFAVLKDNETIISQHRLFLARFKDLALQKPRLSIKQSGDKTIITSPVYVWGVCLDIDGESDISDNCFDLLPGIPYMVNRTKNEKIEVKMTGNDLMNN
ncbi:MAG: glycoside hydrolase family 2 protein [Mangrovibacterium sp.]